MKPSSSIFGLVITLVVAAAVAWVGSDASVEIGGFSAFAWCGLLAFGINWMAFVPSYLARTERFFDLTGSVSYLAVIILALLAADNLDRWALGVAMMVALWAVRLGIFLSRRIWAEGKDGRFDKIKTDFWRLLMTWSLQGLWVYLTGATAIAIIVVAERRPLGVWGVVGFLFWLLGWGIEVLADEQRSRFKADPTNDGRYITTDCGLGPDIPTISARSYFGSGWLSWRSRSSPVGHGQCLFRLCSSSSY